MWHEARKQERKIRGMLVDYRKRAERRRDFYEKIKADPTQFLQIHGRQCKIHLDPAIAAAAEGPATMMPWQGQSDNLIDRFDVRAHLDFIPAVAAKVDEEATAEERQLNYERYRIIAQNAFLSINEEKFLKQLHLEEQFGYTENEPKKKKPTGGAAIGFTYEDSTGGASYTPAAVSIADDEEASEDNSDSDLDVDLSINISKIDSTQAHEMNRHGRNFGMSSNDFYSFLTNDLEEAESFKLAKEEEHEKALFSGRKSRRERRAHREKRLANRKISPPSYAAKESPTFPVEHDKSESRSPSPENTGKITFITSFGDEEEPQMPAKPTYADKVKFGAKLKRLRQGQENCDRKVFMEARSKEPVNFKRKERPSPRRPRSASRTRKIRSRRSSTSSFSSRSSSRSRSKRRRMLRRHASSSSSSSSSRYSWRRKSRRRGRRSRSRSSSLDSDSSSTSKSTHKSKSKSRSSSSGKSKSRSRSRSRAESRAKSPLSVKKDEVSPEKVQLIEQPPTENNHIGVNDVANEMSVKEDVKKEDKPLQLPRYYGRRKSDQSSSDIADSTDEDSNDSPKNTQTNNSNLKIGNSGTATKGGGGGTSSKSSANAMSLAERLKRKRQALLNKQFKADKIAEQMKTEREKQEQQTREDELRELALKLRRRQRERRHAYDSDSSGSSSTSRSKSASQSPKGKRSRSASPKERRRDEHKEYARRHAGSSRDYDRDRDREYERGRERDRNREREREREKSRSREREARYRRSSRYCNEEKEKRNDDRQDRQDRYYKDERRRDGRDGRERERDNEHQHAKRSLVDY